MGLRELLTVEVEKQEPESVTSLEYLQRIYRDTTQPTAVRMRAAIESLPYENPKLSAMSIAAISGNDFARALDKAIEASNKAKLIELAPVEAQVCEGEGDD